MRETIEVEVCIKETVTANVHVCDIIQAVNELPTLTSRWNCIASILKHIDVHNGELLPEHKKVIVDWLEKQLKRFNDKQP